MKLFGKLNPGNKLAVNYVISSSVIKAVPKTKFVINQLGLFMNQCFLFCKQTQLSRPNFVYFDVTNKAKGGGANPLKP